MTSPTTSEQIGYLNTLEDTASMLQKAQINIKKCPKQRLTEGYIKARLKIIEDYWDTFKKAHSCLINCTPREERSKLSYFLNEDYYKFEELYLCIHADLYDLLSKLEIAQKDENNSSISHEEQMPFAKLPRIQLPTFSGRYEDWPSFQDLFLALVHNTTINDVQKLHYLKTSVSGEAEILIRNIQITENNYTLAWELLKGRFGNKRMIVNSILKRLFGQKKIINQSAIQIKDILDTTMECITNLNNFKISTESWDPVIVFLVSQKLDSESLKDWETYAYKENCDELPQWYDMRKFLELKFRTLELIAPVTSNLNRERQSSHKLFHAITEEQEEDDILQSAHITQTGSSPLCRYCKTSGHYIYNCKEFLKQSIDQRHAYVKKNNMCFNCLLSNHNVYRCNNKIRCRICGRKHNSLLHQDNEIKQNNEEGVSTEHNIINAHFSSEQPSHKVLLATAQVKIKSTNGNTYTFRALIDQGSEASFVTARVVELLGLLKTNINGVVSGVGEGTQILIKHFVNLSIASQYNENEEMLVKAYVLKTISTRLPSKQITNNWQELQTLQLADPTYSTPCKIDLLLGAEVFCKIIEEGLVKITDSVVAQKTSLGWILSGQMREQVDTNNKFKTLHVTNIHEDNDLLKKFWEIETELYRKKKILTKEEIECENIYKNTTKRDETGRYIVYLPLRQNLQETVNLCGDTKQQAISRFLQLERKFRRNSHLKEEYTKVIHEYQEMGHMRKTAVFEHNKPAIYLPHHAVIREDKDTTKVRVVFDASAKGTNGYSLNETMMTGPVLQLDLRSLILKWRMHKICVVGDIVKMYRMIKMAEEHTNLQRIIWRDNEDQELESYNLTTVSFGTAAAPFLSIRTLMQLADDEENNFPDVSSVIKDSFYVDDLMTGNESIDKTKKMCEEIKEMLKRGGFKMQKWSSNSEEVLKYLQNDNSTKDEFEIKFDKFIKILGLTWDRKDDAFKVTVNLPEIISSITKRSILSDIARLFDPFGWLSPVIVSAKSLIQKLWLCRVGWDDELPSNLSEEWIKYREKLVHLQNIKIPRWLQISDNIQDIQLHGFSDASIQAYAAVTYLRIVINDNIHVTMIASRTKIAPLKQMSIPKLELCAAALLAEIINNLEEILNIPKNKIFAWTDSMVVLSWLQSHPSRWRTFVANRVADITRVVDNSCWRHVPSSDNPADIATRGIQAIDLANLELWWMGPEWLKERDIDKKFLQSFPQTELEVKQTSFNIILKDNPIWERFSDLQRMKRVLAYCRRMLKKKKEEIRHKYLTAIELERVLEECIKYYQNLVYRREVEELKKDGRVKKRSSLITYSPYLDETGLIRVGGRLEHASCIETMKHPIIIPNKQHITRLLTKYAHEKTLHGGVQLMMSYLRTKYWVIGLKSAVKKCIRCCKICIIDKARTKNQFMGQLPQMRVNQYRAFLNCGVDYAGPILIRTSKGRGHHSIKGYICLFICMSTRAIHLEAVTDLSAQAFIAAFRRFVARRGHCLNLWSDNGTNFVGASKELKELGNKSVMGITKEVAEVLSNDGTTAHFIPPKMPSYGGLWEAGIQSAKRHLRRVTKDTKLTYEEMTTLLAQIEACLNSRPLCTIDNTVGLPLTPGHFLIGEALIAVPDIQYDTKKINLLTRWQLVQKMTQDFWNRWRIEYLNTLQQRYKWQIVIPAPAIGDIVVIKEDNLPPTKWLMGRIKDLHPGLDNLVRVVTVECGGNRVFKRPLSKIIPLPRDIEYE